MTPRDESLGSGPSGFSSMTQDSISALELDSSLRFFWLDYLEHDGKVRSIGRLKDKGSGVWASCCVTVENLRRNLSFPANGAQKPMRMVMNMRQTLLAARELP